MSSPAEKINQVAASIPAMLEGMDARTRLDVLLQATEAVQSLRSDIGVLRATAMRAYVDEIGATKAARELGISRGRVYQLLERE